MEFDSIDILIRLIIAHLIADFLLQSNNMVAEKKKTFRSRYFYYHILIVGVVTYLLLAEWQNWQGPLIIMTAHGLIDALKAKITTRSRWASNNAKWIYVSDQFLHLVTLVVYWLLSYQAISDFQFSQKLLDQLIFHNTELLIIVAAYLLVTMPLGVFIGHITRRWQEEIKKDDALKKTQKTGLDLVGDESLRDAGRTIGMIERSLVLTFILIQQYQAIGFLIAAKSVFRFGDLKEPGQRKRTEYILIGTLFSFFLSMLVGLMTRKLIEVLLN